jgi:hypothetical protein
MVQVPVRQQDAGQALETGSGLQDLALRSFSAVNEEAVLVMADNSSRKSTLGGGCGSGSPKEKNFEHR